jgi:hypothetical protein
MTISARHCKLHWSECSRCMTISDRHCKLPWRYLIVIVSCTQDMCLSSELRSCWPVGLLYLYSRTQHLLQKFCTNDLWTTWTVRSGTRANPSGFCPFACELTWADSFLFYHLFCGNLGFSDWRRIFSLSLSPSSVSLSLSYSLSLPFCLSYFSCMYVCIYIASVTTCSLKSHAAQAEVWNNVYPFSRKIWLNLKLIFVTEKQGNRTTLCTSLRITQNEFWIF